MSGIRSVGRWVGCLIPVAVVLMMAPSWGQTVIGKEGDSSIPPNKKAARNFEGLWWPSMGGGPGRGGGPGGAPGGPGAQGGPGGPGNAPGGVPGAGGPPGGGGGPPGGGAVQLSGTTLQCAPVQRMSGSGGGMMSLVIQGPDQLVMISEEDMDIARKVYIGGKHPANLVPQPNGHSIGTWDGDTLVIDSIGYSDRNGKDNGQHVVERMRKEGDKLVSDVTTTDKAGNSRKQTLNWAWRPDLQYNENVCEEGFDRYQVINGQLDNPNIPPDRQESK